MPVGGWFSWGGQWSGARWRPRCRAGSRLGRWRRPVRRRGGKRQPGSSRLVASRSIRPLMTIAGLVIASRVHWRAGRVSTASRRASGAHQGRGAGGGVGEVEQVGSFGVVELQGPGDRVQHLGQHHGQGAAFELGAVLDAHAGQGGDLDPAHPGTRRGPTSASRPAGCDPGPPRDEELADFCTVVHEPRRYAARAGRGTLCQHTSQQGLPQRRQLRFPCRAAQPDRRDDPDPEDETTPAEPGPSS